MEGLYFKDNNQQLPTVIFILFTEFFTWFVQLFYFIIFRTKYIIFLPQYCTLKNVTDFKTFDLIDCCLASIENMSDIFMTKTK
jgi:hypothetical protein